MKASFTLLAFWCATAVSLQGATSVSGRNLTTELIPWTGVPIVSWDTRRPVDFSYAIGSFSSLPDFSTPDLNLSGFTNFSMEGNTFQSTALFPGIIAGPPIDLGVLAPGSRVYVVFGNNLSFPDATEHIVLDLGIDTYPETVGSGGIAFDLETLTSSNHAGEPGTVEVLHGRFTSVAPDGYVPSSATIPRLVDLQNGPALAFGVPEPTSALFLCLGGGLFACRRRRALA